MLREKDKIKIKIRRYEHKTQKIKLITAKKVC